MLYDQINNAENEKENFHTEMEILNDRIKTLSEMVDKTRVNNTILVVVLYF
jgi:peptidoglycan hydrolase CwlO-like protein